MSFDSGKPLNQTDVPQLHEPESVEYKEKRGVLLLNVKKSDLDPGPTAAKAKEGGYDEKVEYHITIIGFKAADEIKKALKALPGNVREAKKAALAHLISETDWRFRPERRWHKIEKTYANKTHVETGEDMPEVRQTFIQMVHVPSLMAFYLRLNAIFGLSLETPPAHVTLYTNGSDKKAASIGIGINSAEELRDLSKEQLHG